MALPYNCAASPSRMACSLPNSSSVDAVICSSCAVKVCRTLVNVPVTWPTSASGQFRVAAARSNKVDKPMPSWSSTSRLSTTALAEPGAVTSSSSWRARSRMLSTTSTACSQAACNSAAGTPMLLPSALRICCDCSSTSCVNASSSIAVSAPSRPWPTRASASSNRPFTASQSLLLTTPQDAVRSANVPKLSSSARASLSMRAMTASTLLTSAAALTLCHSGVAPSSSDASGWPASNDRRERAAVRSI